MKPETFETIIKIFKKTFLHFNKFDLEDMEQIELWYNELAYMEDVKAVLAAKKVIATCEFVTIKNIKQAYGDIESPIKIENEEGWGIVEQAIRIYGYMRADEAMASFPSQLQKAVAFVGGFQSICESENKDVIRGQFNKAMAAANERTRSNNTLGNHLLGQITHYQMLAESKENTRLQINHAAKLEQKELDNNRIEENKQHISNIRDILNKAIGGVSEVRGA
jgi:hypothetical protein